MRVVVKSMKRRQVQVSCDRKPAIEYSVSEKDNGDHDAKKTGELDEWLDSADNRNGAATTWKASKSSWDTILGVFAAFVLCNLDKVRKKRTVPLAGV